MHCTTCSAVHCLPSLDSSLLGYDGTNPSTIYFYLLFSLFLKILCSHVPLLSYCLYYFYQRQFSYICTVCYFTELQSTQGSNAKNEKTLIRFNSSQSINEIITGTNYNPVCLFSFIKCFSWVTSNLLNDNCNGYFPVLISPELSFGHNFPLLSICNTMHFLDVLPSWLLFHGLL